MSTMLKEVYDAFKEAGASEEKASAAAVAVAAYQLNRSNLATKEDIAKLKEDIAGLRTELRTTRAEFVTEVERMGRVVIMWSEDLARRGRLCFCDYTFRGGRRPMKLEPKPVLQATFYVALLVGLFVLIIILPQWVIAAVVLPLLLGIVWWLLYTAFRELHRFKKLE
jgi:hypothetical protein